MGNEVVVEKVDQVAVITFNMPDRLNAFSTGLTKAFLETLHRIEKAKEIRAVVITGQGKGFCAGGDLKEFSQQEEKAGYIRDLAGTLHECIISLRRMHQPVIAAVNGVASGAGMSLVLACDLAAADENASFNMAYIKLGGSPDGGGSLVLARTLGLKRATELIFSGRMLSAREALEIGIINQVVSPGESLSHALGMAKELAKGPSLALAASKQLINAALFPELECHLERERRTFVELGGTRDFQEGLEAFLEKRRPLFKGE